MLVFNQHQKKPFFFGYPLELVLVLKQHPKETLFEGTLCCWFKGNPTGHDLLESTRFSVGFKGKPKGSYHVGGPPKKETPKRFVEPKFPRVALLHALRSIGGKEGFLDFFRPI